MVRLDEGALEQKLDALERARSWGPRVVSKLEALLRLEDDALLFRVNALAFASERGIEENEAVDLFLHATKLGLCIMEWQLICPQCTDAVETIHSLGAVGSTYHCNLCRKDLETSLDDLIQVTFTVSPALRRLRFHDPDSLGIEDYCWGYHSSGSRGPDGRSWAESIRPFVAALGFVEPGQVRRFELELRPGVIRGVDRFHRAEINIPVRSTPTGVPGPVRLRLEGGRFLPEALEIDSGPAVLEIENGMERRAAITTINIGPGRSPGPFVLPRFLTGKRLFVTQTFGDLFRSETVGRGGLALKDLTFLFTDLKGSTALYDRIGDLKAFHLVDQHFDRLGQVIRRHHGAIVKTIGDAVMASFAGPQHAVACGVEMLRTIDDFNRERGSRDVILKLGLHCGSSIAVTQNERLDYFGQTVNIAARVQALAAGDEICLTDQVMAAPGVRELLTGLDLTSGEAQLRGIERPLLVHRARAR